MFLLKIYVKCLLFKTSACINSYYNSKYDYDYNVTWRFPRCEESQSWFACTSWRSQLWKYFLESQYYLRFPFFKNYIVTGNSVAEEIDFQFSFISCHFILKLNFQCQINFCEKRKVIQVNNTYIMFFYRI